ncbi:hypothetical protein BJ085DRAFT_28567 [Dimargaris cristalligena]|uniref:Uncharacterized protein n=1 Tax=Dimargaris cristalligena TaxID=215637 RepID=A0A4V1J3Y3_9FUNG|nr:hypothetical protein BJ085DRAFT_28567 [Dimargaris cristalligena]|eukprot:RKP33659.1 hypothetical protein BJ085DRAFT_28567 [Dimargaris cristalligena]
MDLAATLTQLFKQTKTTNDVDKLHYLLNAVNSDHQKQILRNSVAMFVEAINICTYEENLDAASQQELEDPNLDLFTIKRANNSELVANQVKQQKVNPNKESNKLIVVARAPEPHSCGPPTLKLMASANLYSIEDLLDTKATISFGQLIQCAPSIKTELLKLCYKETEKENLKIDHESYTAPSVLSQWFLLPSPAMIFLDKQ